MELRAINETERLYVFTCNGHVSCIGFTNLNGRHARLSGEFGFPAPTECGTAKAFGDYAQALEAAQKTFKRSFCELSPQLRGLEGKKVQVITEDYQTYIFRVGISTGWQPVHLECKARSLGAYPASRTYRKVKVL